MVLNGQIPNPVSKVPYEASSYEKNAFLVYSRYFEESCLITVWHFWQFIAQICHSTVQFCPPPHAFKIHQKWAYLYGYFSRYFEKSCLITVWHFWRIIAQISHSTVWFCPPPHALKIHQKWACCLYGYLILLSLLHIVNLDICQYILPLHVVDFVIWRCCSFKSITWGRTCSSKDRVLAKKMSSSENFQNWFFKSEKILQNLSVVPLEREHFTNNRQYFAYPLRNSSRSDKIEIDLVSGAREVLSGIDQKLAF